MKQTLILIALIAAALLVPLHTHAQIINPSGSGAGCIATVSTLSSACGTTAGTVASVTDGSTGSDCTVGSGSNKNVCIYSGSAWAYAGSASGSIAPLQLTNANTVEQYNSTNAQTFNLYGTRTDATHYENIGLTYDGTNSFYELVTGKGSGSGSLRGICFNTTGSENWCNDANGEFRPFVDNSKTLGTSTAAPSIVFTHALTQTDTAANADVTMTNTTTATSGTTNASPIHQWIANYWTGTVSAADAWSANHALAAGTNGVSTFSLTHSGSTGNAIFNVPAGSVGSYGGLAFGASNIQLGGSTNTFSVTATGGGNFPVLRFYAGGSQLQADLTTASATTTLEIETGPGELVLAGLQHATTAGTDVLIGGAGGNNGNTIATSGAAIGVALGNGSTGNAGSLIFAPTAISTATFTALQVKPQLNPSASWTGSYCAVCVNSVETALSSSTGNYLLHLFAGSTGATDEAGVTNTGVFESAGVVGVTASTLCSATFGSTGGIVTACTATSDPRLKVFGDYSGGLAQILQLQPIHFHWNEEGLKINPVPVNSEQVGFNAANVESVMPEAVGRDENGYRTLPQGDRPIVAALVNAVKEQQAEIDALKAQIAALLAHDSQLAAHD